MINRVNERPLTVEERKSILRRALNAVPYFNVLNYDVIGGGKQKQYAGKTYNNLDFYLTQIQGNFNEVFLATSTDWLVNVYIAETGQSVYGYNKGEPLPTAFVMNDAPSGIIFANRRYDDLQREWFPFEIPRGKEIISQIVNVDTKDDVADAVVVFSGFNILRYPYLNADETARINASLNDDPIFQTFIIDVDHQGQKFYSLDNDSRPRLILGFGIVDTNSDPADSSISDISIFDATRHVKLTNRQVPVQFIAPRMSTTADKHINYLPIEHYWMPFGTLRFLVNNVDPASPVQEGYQLVMLTRTV